MSKYVYYVKSVSKYVEYVKLLTLSPSELVKMSTRRHAKS